MALLMSNKSNTWYQLSKPDKSFLLVKMSVSQDDETSCYSQVMQCLEGGGGVSESSRYSR